jgi:hypothetical protein
MTTPKLSITNIKKYLKENELDAVDFYCDWSITSLRNNRQDIVDHFGISSIEVDDVQTSDESRLTVRY